MFKKLLIYAFTFIGAIMILSSCEKEYESITDIDETRLTQYITSNNLQVTKDPTGFYYQVVSPGTGENYKNTDSVLYHFVIKSLTGTSYYDTKDYADNLGTRVGYSERINATKSIPALRTTIQALKPGGVANILLPSYLAFGRNGESDLNVPSNEPVVITVTTYEERSQAERDEKLIQAFLVRNNLTATRDDSGVYYIINTPGAGKEINIGSTVYPFYTGRYLDGKQFDSNADTAVSYSLASRMPGWQRTFPLVKEGGKLRLLIPSGLAYGSSGGDSVKKMNVILDYDLEVRKVKN